MRRKDRQVTSREGLEQIIANCKICRLAMMTDDGLYIVPMNFGYQLLDDDSLELYFHSAPEGRKIEALRAAPSVCFEMDCEHELLEANVACGYSFAYSSIVGNGTTVFFEDLEEKRLALLKMMQHQTGKNHFTFPDEALRRVTVFKVNASHFTGKSHSKP